MSDTLTTAISGLNDAVLRVQTAAKNIAGSMVSGRLPETAGEKPTSYIPQDVVSLSQAAGNTGLGVFSTTTDRTPAYEPAYDPTSPDANAAGVVATPAVDVAGEIVGAKVASLAYQANVAVIKAQSENDRTLMQTIL